MQFDPTSKKLRIGAAELCHAVVNHASIDLRGVRIREDDGKVDALLEAQYGTNYRAGVELCRTVSRGGLFYEIRGAADGILRQSGKTTVCVNRTVNDYTSKIDSDAAAEFVALAALLSYMTAESEMLGSVGFRLTFFHSKHDVSVIEKTFSRRELGEAVMRLVDLHRPFAALEAERLCVRVPNCSSLAFPYPEMRDGQRDFIVEVLRAVKSGGKALIEAPTGIGKTVAALYPALRALGAGLIDKVFYFTSKNTTALAALDAARKMSASTGIRAIHITAKEKLCPVGLRDPLKCTPSVCPRAKGHYKRANDAIADIVGSCRVCDGDALSEFAKQHSVCPYEFALDLSEQCDLIVCDCNYLIDEAAYFRRYFDGDAGGRYIFLFDEAHNLLDRAKACYGAELRLSELRRFLDETRSLPKNAVCDSLAALEFYIDSMRELCSDSSEEGDDGVTRGFTTLHSFDKQLYDLLTAFERAATKYIHSPLCGSLPDSLHDLHRKVRKYIGSMELFDRCFVGTVTVHGEEVVTKIVCLDPSELLAKKTARGRATIFFSATLTPLDYYASLYGAPDAVKLKLDCPYDPANLCVCIMDKLSVRFQYRSQSAAAVADAIMSTVSRRDGNYMVYFPSYAYMSEVQTLFKYKYPHIRTVVQAKEMSEHARRGFLDAFRAGARTTLVGFSVLGGIYSEGIDLVGDRLIGSVVVGVGLVQPSDENELLREYYDDKYELGREYAYIYPGFNRVLQAAGRVIRTETDRGVIVFIDERYADPTYKELMPTQYRRAKFVGDAPSLASVLDRFWEGTK